MKSGINAILNILGGLLNKLSTKDVLFVCASLIALCVLASNNSVLRKRGVRPQTEMVYIINADETLGDEVLHPGITVLRGHVRLRHKGMYLSCDSAFLNDKTNTFDAFGDVHIRQGDTLHITSDFLYYDGMQELAKFRRNVKMKNRNTVLITDSLDYNRKINKAYYFQGGTLFDKDNVLVSDWGEYNPASKTSIFNYNVRLVNKKLTLNTDTLKYNTNTGIASVFGPSKIDTKQDHIKTNKGWYNTRTDQSGLLSRSEITTEKGRKLVGDTVFYNKKRAFGEAFGNVFLLDTANKAILRGGYCNYSESGTKSSSMATKHALAIDYSQGDTVYLHGDTLKMKSFNVNTDSLYRELFAYHKVRVFRNDVQGVCDSLFFSSKDTCMHMYKDPILWHEGQQVLGEEIQVFFNDSTVSRAHIINQALSIQKKDTVHYNQVTGKDMYLYFTKGDLKRTDVIGSVRIAYYPQEKDSSMIGLNRSDAGTMNVYTDQKKIKKIVLMTQPSGTLYPLAMVPDDKLYLDNFAWFDYIRPLNKDDVFTWRGKKKGTELKNTGRKDLPLPNRGLLGDSKKKDSKENIKK